MGIDCQIGHSQLYTKNTYQPIFNGAFSEKLLPLSEVGCDHAFIMKEFIGWALQAELAGFQHVAVIGGFQCGAGVLLDE